MNLIINYSAIVTLAEVLTAIGGTYYTVLKIYKELQKSKKNHSDKILQQAKEYDKEVRIELENKISLLKSQLDNLEVNINKDLNHVKETQANEIKNLAVKIEELRQEIQAGHSNLINLLTKLVEKN